MATATGDIVLDYSGLDDANPYVHDSGVYTQSGPGFLISSGALKAISGFSFVNVSDTPSGDSFSIEIEVASVSSSDPMYITALDVSGNGYGFSLLSGSASYLYKITAFALDGSGITPNGGGHAIGDNFLMTVDKDAGSISVSRNGGTATVYSGLVDYMAAALRPGIAYARNNVGSSGFSSWGATGYTASATATLDDDNLTYGAAFTGTLANMDPVPTSLTISDGTRSATVAIITDAGTFAGTMPALPAAGAEQAAGSQVYPGGVTMTIGSVEIETTLALEAGDDSIIVGASPVYTAYDNMGWTEAQRPATGDCLIWDDKAGEVTFFTDLTVDVNVEVTDGYLCIIRADGAAEANAFRSTGVSEIGAVDPEPPGVVISQSVRRSITPSASRSIQSISSSIS